ncbi:MAG: TetR family transcriptional regulator [Actinobacteria bacterium]|nr:TetR family transcriptional regulator [Actinomycetota bacterium]
MDKEKAGPIGRRERKKKQTRDALESTALKLFKKKGYDKTTIKEITETVDVSLRTFFRYFDSKEAVLFGDWRDQLNLVRELILSRPQGEPVLATLYATARLLAELDRDSEERIMLIRRLARDSRRLGDYERNVIYPGFEDTVCQALAQRMNVDPASDPRPRLIAAIAVAAWTTARRIWMESEGKRSVFSLLQEVFDLIEPGGEFLGDLGRELEA